MNGFLSFYKVSNKQKDIKTSLKHFSGNFQDIPGDLRTKPASAYFLVLLWLLKISQFSIRILQCLKRSHWLLHAFISVLPRFVPSISLLVTSVTQLTKPSLSR